jgi:isopentenyl diphosphate isomerase/L-lactate dehydrogenase-like FMN-dependent dehydrogenase
VRPEPINVYEFEAMAKERLPKEEYDYIAGGATDEISVERNWRAYRSWALRPRVLTDVSVIDLSTTVLGTTVQLPVLLAPCGAHSRAHPDGELATYRAAAACGTILAVSANSTTRFEDLAKAASGHLWLQLYPFADRGLTKDWIRRGKEAGYEAICVTLDAQWPPKRERNIRNNYKGDRGVNYPRTNRVDDLQADPDGRPLRRERRTDPAATWKDLEWIKAQAELPVIAKGIMTGEDIELCVDAGADGGGAGRARSEEAVLGPGAPGEVLRVRLEGQVVDRHHAGAGDLQRDRLEVRGGRLQPQDGRQGDRQDAVLPGV